MLERSTDAGLLNRIINDPSVFPHVNLGYEGPFDLTPIIEDENSYFLAASQVGGFLFTQMNGKDPRILEVHTFFLPEGRGVFAADAAKEAAGYIFTNTSCLVILTYIQESNKGARKLALNTKFELLGPGTVLGVPVQVYGLSKARWSKLLCQ